MVVQKIRSFTNCSQPLLDNEDRDVGSVQHICADKQRGGSIGMSTIIWEQVLRYGSPTRPPSIPTLLAQFDVHWDDDPSTSRLSFESPRDPITITSGLTCGRRKHEQNDMIDGGAVRPQLHGRTRAHARDHQRHTFSMAASSPLRVSSWLARTVPRGVGGRQSKSDDTWHENRGI